MILQSDIRQIICNELEIESVLAKFDEDDNLLELGLDSLNVIKLVVAFETKYNIEFPDEYLSVNNMSSLASIHKTIIKVLEYEEIDE